MRRVLLLVVLAAASCGSFNCQIDKKYKGPRFYGGVRYDLFAIDVVSDKSLFCSRCM